MLELTDTWLSQVLGFISGSTLMLDLNTLSEMGQKQSSSLESPLLSYCGQ